MLNVLPFRRRTSLVAAAASTQRLEVCPPSVLPGFEPPWSRLMQWLREPMAAEAGSATGGDRLQRVRREFHEALGDIGTAPAARLQRSITRALSLRELWHLRPALFDAISMQHSQQEANRRLAALNRHFPTRSPRSGFAPLDA